MYISNVVLDNEYISFDKLLTQVSKYFYKIDLKYENTWYFLSGYNTGGRGSGEERRGEERRRGRIREERRGKERRWRGEGVVSCRLAPLGGQLATVQVDADRMDVGAPTQQY